MPTEAVWTWSLSEQQGCTHPVGVPRQQRGYAANKAAPATGRTHGTPRLPPQRAPCWTGLWVARLEAGPRGSAEARPRLRALWSPGPPDGGSRGTQAQVSPGLPVLPNTWDLAGSQAVAGCRGDRPSRGRLHLLAGGSPVWRVWGCAAELPVGASEGRALQGMPTDTPQAEHKSCPFRSLLFLPARAPLRRKNGLTRSKQPGNHHRTIYRRICLSRSYQLGL